MKSYCFLLLLIIIFTGCSISDSSSEKRIKDPTGTKTVALKYARGFSIQIAANCKVVTVFDPWNYPDTLASYCIGKDDAEYDNGFDFVIHTPVNRVACLSSSNLAMMNLIDEGKKISASSDARLIYDQVLYERYSQGSLTDLGNTHLLNAEMIIDHSPDILMKYIYGSKEMVDEKIIEAGFPVAFNLEFMENHPLGRAEWIKFVAAFFDKDKMADSIFNTIESEYLRLVDLCAGQENRPTVLDGSSYKGVWYTAGGKSYSARMYADAGADYYWHADSNKGSIPVSFETIIDKQSEADFWLNPSSGSREDLLSVDQRYTMIKSFNSGAVYFFGKRRNPDGGLDYFESGVTRPDLVLKDLISVFHPELLDSEYESVYLEKMY